MNLPRFLIAVSLLLLQACGDTSARNYGEKIVGTWSVVSFDEYVSYHEKTYFPDGTACGFFLDGPYGDLPAELDTFSSTWRIEGDRLISTVRETTSQYLEVGVPIVDTIVELNDRELVIRDVNTGEVGHRARVMADRGNSLCEL